MRGISSLYLRLFYLALFGVLLIICTVAVVVGSPFLLKGFGYILPGMSVAGLDVGVQRTDVGEKIINDYWNKSRKIVVTDGSSEWATTPRKLGLTVDAIATADLAYQIGYQQKTSKLLNEFWGRSDKFVTIPPVVRLETETLMSALNGLSQIVYKDPENASIAFSNGSFISVKGEYGKKLDIQKTYQSIAEDPRLTYISGYLFLVMELIPPEYLELPTRILDELHTLETDPIKINTFDPITNESFGYPIDFEVLVSGIKIDADFNHFSIIFDHKQTEKILGEIDQLLGEGRYLDRSDYQEKFQDIFQNQNIGYFIIRHESSQYKPEPGDTLISIAWDHGINYWRIIEANPGIENTGVLAGKPITIPSKDDQLPLPIIVEKRIVVTLKNQRIQAYENGNEVINEVISTGIADSPTQPGIFQVQTHDPYAYASNWDLWMPNFIGIYEAWPGFMNGFHALPILSNGSRLWAGSLGRPVSYGCIILDVGVAQWLYDWAEPGVVVEIRP